MKEIIHAISHLLKQGEGIVLATIISDEGSTPRSSGSKMIVREKDTPIGTIGGGLLEAEVLRDANEVFKTKTALIRSFDMTQKESSDMDMICGGKLDVLLEYVGPEPQHKELFEKISETIQNKQKCTLSTFLTNLKKIPIRLHRFLILEDGSIHGDFPYPSAALDRLKEAANRNRTAFLLPIGERTFFLEPFQELGFLMVFGAGHVSQPTAIHGAQLSFRVMVVDDRIEFANRERFPEPVEIRVLSNFNDCLNGLTVDEDSYLVIVTRGHLHDKIVLAQALRTRAGYIGMIGSKQKRSSIYESLLHEGFTAEDLQRVHSPIGLDIGAETPEEIAISIVAELIQVRSRKQR